MLCICQPHPVQPPPSRQLPPHPRPSFAIVSSAHAAKKSSTTCVTSVMFCCGSARQSSTSFASTTTFALLSRPHLGPIRKPHPEAHLSPTPHSSRSVLQETARRLKADYDASLVELRALAAHLEEQLRQSQAANDAQVAQLQLRAQQTLEQQAAQHRLEMDHLQQQHHEALAALRATHAHECRAGLGLGLGVGRVCFAGLLIGAVSVLN